MAELYPNDDLLLALAQDEGTGVDYIETGRTPYYLEFRRMLYRLLDTARRAGDLRVYADGDLSIGVKPGAFWDGAVLRDYGGCDQSPLVDDRAAIYVYLNRDGGLVTDEYTGFPEPDVLHIRLARIETSGGKIAAIVDCRGQQLWNQPVSGAHCVGCGVNGTPMILFHVAVENGATVNLHAGDAPYGYRIIDAWSIARGTASGSWQLQTGVNPVSDLVSLPTQSGGLSRAGLIDPVYAEISLGGSLAVVGDGANAHVDVYIAAVRMV